MSFIPASVDPFRRGGTPTGVSPAEHGRQRMFWLFVLPALLFYVVFFVAPALYGVWVSFLQWRGTGDPQRFVGFANYKRLWNDEVYRLAFRNSIEILFVCGIAVFVLSFLVASVLRELKAKRALQAILFFPYMVSPIAVGIALSLLMSPDGIVNASLRFIGLGSLAKLWLTPDLIFSVILVGLVWVSSGFYITLMMAAIGRIPPYYYEQSALDGAGRFRTFWNVTLPLAWDVVSVAVVLWAISAIKVFEFVYGLVGTGANPAPQSRTLAIAQFLATTGGKPPQYQMGVGSAMAVVMVLLILVLVVLLRRVMRRESMDL